MADAPVTRCCPYCGSTLDIAPRATLEWLDKQPGPTRKCPDCKRHITVDAPGLALRKMPGDDPRPQYREGGFIRGLGAGTSDDEPARRRRLTTAISWGA